MAGTGSGMPPCLFQESIILQVNKYAQARWCACEDSDSNFSRVWKYSTWSPHWGSPYSGNAAWPTDWPDFGSRRSGKLFFKEEFMALSAFAAHFSPHLFLHIFFPRVVQRYSSHETQPRNKRGYSKPSTIHNPLLTGYLRRRKPTDYFDFLVCF